jgi:hypothetical protein
MNPLRALLTQPTPVLVALYRHLKFPVTHCGVINPIALTLLRLLHGRGYPLKELL